MHDSSSVITVDNSLCSRETYRARIKSDAATTSVGDLKHA